MSGTDGAHTTDLALPIGRRKRSTSQSKSYKNPNNSFQSNMPLDLLENFLYAYNN
jgi:hypothetical protein